MKNFHAIRVRYIGPTNYSGSRISLKSWRYKQRKTLNGNGMQTLEQAIQYLVDKGFNIVGYSDLEGTPDYIVLSDTFKPLR